MTVEGERQEARLVISALRNEEAHCILEGKGSLFKHQAGKEVSHKNTSHEGG